MTHRLVAVIAAVAATTLAAASTSSRADALTTTFEAAKNASCSLVAASVPSLPPSGVKQFMTAYQAFNGSGSEAAVKALASGLLAAGDVKAFLSAPWTGGALDTAMVTCAVVSAASPSGLGRFAARGAREAGAVAALLGDPLLMRDALVAGGAAGGAYGEASMILSRIYNASSVLPSVPVPPPGGPWDDRNQTTMLRRLALGTALGHAVPVPVRFHPVPNVTTVDPVRRYLEYERHYLAGDLDPALEVLTAFELRWTTDSEAPDDDLDWLRRTMAGFRPEHIARPYAWRYAQAVHTDVAYGDSQCAAMPGICNGHYSQIPAAGGECGWRAFFGRFTRKAFGLPTWGVTQTGHAAMTTWTPAGWEVLLGAGWEYGWWGPRGGSDFYLETRCREIRPAYQHVLRGQWAAIALGEAPVNPAWTPRSPSTYGQGGPWSALMLYAKKLAVNASGPQPPRPMGPSVVPTFVAALNAKWQRPRPAENITVDARGTIVVPASAVAFKQRSASVEPMWSGDAGQQLLVNAGSFAHPQATGFSYVLDAEQAGTRYLTVNHSTWHMNTDLLLETNTTSAPAAVPVFDTVGRWNQTQPVPVRLLRGRNVLTFTRSTPASIAIKAVLLYATRPDIPPPDKNHTSKPQPKPSDFIEVGPTTTCVKQGITDVPKALCQMACEAVGLKFTGDKQRTNMTACFGLTDGRWKGNCGYNLNASGVICDDPPCKVFGSTAQQICMRA